VKQDVEGPEGNPGAEQPQNVALFARLEGRILAIALVLIAIYLTWLGLGCPGFPKKSHLFLGMTATLVFFGRMAGMSFGYAAGLEHTVVVPIAVIVETLMVLLFYPLFVLSSRRLLVIGAFKNLLERIHTAAEAHNETIVRLGIPGLLFFVWFPFFMTGPVVGCAIGYLLGLRPWVTLSVVLAGNSLAIASWALILRNIRDRVAAYHVYAPIALVAIGIMVLVAIFVIRSMRREKNSRKTRTQD